MTEMLREKNALDIERYIAKRFRNLAAGVMVRQLLYLEGRGMCEDAWIFKSAADWWEEESLSRSMLETATGKLVEAGLLETKQDIRPTDRRPCTFYRLNVWALAQLIDPAELKDLEPELLHLEEEDLPKSDMLDAEIPQARMQDSDNYLRKSCEPHRGPHRERQKKTSGEEITNTDIDETTRRCLEVLERIDSFPRLGEQAASKRIELREEFPDLDPVVLCGDYATWIADNPSVRKNHLSRLRTFFRNAQKWSGPNPVNTTNGYGRMYVRG